MKAYNTYPPHHSKPIVCSGWPHATVDAVELNGHEYIIIAISEIEYGLHNLFLDRPLETEVKAGDAITLL